MGILDDAIREHLELKRQHGADNDDLDRLEKEAFGPPSRPGDPEFDTSEGESVAPAPEAETTEEGSPEAAAAAPPETGVEETETAERQPEIEPEPPEPPPETGESSPPASGGLFDAEAEHGDDDWLASLEEVVEQPAVERPSETEPETDLEGSGPEDATTSPIEDLTPAERARIEHADLDDTVDHPAVPEPPETAEEAPPEPPESAIFDDEDDEDFGDLDLELDEPPPQAAGPTTSTEMDALPPRREPDTGEDYVADADEEDELEDEDEDLLEETPDFLQDTPEGERLWFEQGAPKDFDFDDDEDEDD